MSYFIDQVKIYSQKDFSYFSHPNFSLYFDLYLMNVKISLRGIFSLIELERLRMS